EDPALRRVDVWLVDGAPELYQVAQLVYNSAHERQESGRRPARGPAAFAGEPGRVREVVKGQHRAHPLLAQLAQHVAVVTQLAAVELAFLRLHTGPLDRKPVRVVVHLA